MSTILQTFEARFVDDQPLAVGVGVVTKDDDGYLRYHARPADVIQFVEERTEKVRLETGVFLVVGKIRWKNVPEPYATLLRNKRIEFEAR